MQVVLTRTGGVAGLRREWTVETDTQPDPGHWAELVTRLPWRPADRTAHQPAATEQSSRPDQFQYRIRCDQREISLAESQLTGPWRELVDQVIAARTRP